MKGLVVVVVAATFQVAGAAIACQSSATGFCTSVVGPGSVCNQNGVCSNPYESGCLRSKLGAEIFPGKRACNSDDPPEAQEAGLCDVSPFNYTEIRIHNANWESSIFYAWAMQLLLSEALLVPVTVGLGPETLENSFYDPNNRFSYSPKAYDYDALAEANKNGGDCTKSGKECMHIMPEVWNGQVAEYNAAVDDGIIEPVEGDGQIGKISWYIPKYTAEKYSELTSFYGLGGEDNRPKLAEIFKRPTTWKTYCDEVSADKCATPDGVAWRYPQDGEQGSYFVGRGFYIGHFRSTEDNDCTTTPESCTGHIVAPPCAWSSFIDPQLYWNDIALKSSGDDPPNDSYSYGEMIAIWDAANATKSDVIMWWFTPDATVERFRGSDFEFQPILLREPTAECRDNRISADARCSSEVGERLGEPEGSCDSEAHALQKLVASSLREATLQKPVAERSPGYETIRTFKISDLDMDDILRDWITRGRDTYGFDGREAVCKFVVDKLDDFMSFIPPGYPRTLSDDNQYNSPFMIVAQSFGALAASVVFIAGGLVFYRRRTRVFVFAQVDFVLLLIVGLFLVAMGSIVYAIKPNAGVCVAREWLVYLGYTWILVPLLVKSSAINRVLHSAKKMKRVKISIRNMFITVAVVILLVAVFLVVWTLVDLPSPTEDLVLEEENGSLVQSQLSCSSESSVWLAVSYGWIALLLIMATVLAFQTRKVAQEFNESQSLGTMIYSHFLFMILRSVTAALEGNGTFSSDWASGAMSLLLSVDVIFAVVIYLVPKLSAAQKDPEPFNRGASSDPITTSGPVNRNTKSSKKGGSKSKNSVGPARSFVAAMESIDEDPVEDESSKSTDDNSKGPKKSFFNGHAKYGDDTLEAQTDENSSSGGSGVKAHRARMREIEDEFAMFKTTATGGDFGDEREIPLKE